MRKQIHSGFVIRMEMKSAIGKLYPAIRKKLPTTLKYAVLCICFLSFYFFFFAFALSEGADDGNALQVPDSLSDLLISGVNTLRFEHYNTSGDEASSLYQFEGPQTYNQFNLNMNMRPNPYRTWRGRISGVVNESDFRLKDRGFVPERLNLLHERGDFAVPFRIEIGDYYHYFSQQTIQLSLKGIQLELQPNFWKNADRSLSLQLATGARQTSWKDFRLTENLTKGASLVFEDALFGSWYLNYVHNTRKASQSGGTLHRAQDIVGLAMEHIIPIGNQDITIEAEFDYFSGDHDGIAGVESGQDRAENAIYFQLSGKSDELPLTYRFLFEDYGQDYRPDGANVASDRRTGEAHVGWRLKSGLKTRGRFQHYRNGVETGDPVDTYTTGIVLSGPFLKSIVNDLSGNIRAYLQDTESRNKNSNTTTYTINSSFNKPLFAGWNAQVDVFYMDVNNQNHDTNDSVTRQFKISGDHALRLFGLEGNVRPGVMTRQIDNLTGGTDDWYPTLAVNLRRGNHSLGYDMGYNYQNRRVLSDTNFKTLSQNFNYRYSKGSNTFGMEFNGTDRNPDPGSVSKSVRLAVYWTHQIGKTVRLRKLFRRSTERTTKMYNLPYPSSGDSVNLAELSPDTDMKYAKERLKRAGITGASEQTGLITYEVVVLNTIDQRQRLALVNQDGILQKAALVIDFDDIGNHDEMKRTFERVRKELMGLYGRPSGFFEEGVFSSNLVDDINRGSFKRVMEWTMPDGIIRYGIPRRLDSRIRMEVQYSAGFPPESHTLWSIERVK